MSGVDQSLLVTEDLTVALRTAQGVIRPVDAVSLNLEPNRTLAIVGESGSGKSMLCRAILGLVPSSGNIIFNGQETGRMSLREINRFRGREIGVVLQDPLSSLNPVMTIVDQITEPMRCHLGISRSEAKGRALALLRDVGIPNPEERLSFYPHQLSGGMRQRVAIAIALACNPTLLIADEPTTALDASLQGEILRLLERIRQERNMAILLVSHDLGMVADYADEIAVMYAGRIVEHAPAATLVNRMQMHYTRALFMATPRIEAPPKHRLPTIPGQPPDFSSLPPGCRFAPRCSHAGERCHSFYPPLAADVDNRHRFSCWFPRNPPAETHCNADCPDSSAEVGHG